MFNTGFQAFAAVGVTAVAASTIFIGAPAQAASSGSARLISGEVFFTAAQGHANRIVVTRSGNSIILDDVVEIRGTAGCSRVGTDKTRVRCAAAKALTYVALNLGDKNDTASNKSSVHLDAWGGAGGDVLTGGNGGDSLNGGPGNDRLYGLAGGDALVDGPGNDWLDGGPGDDILNSEQGMDTLIGGAGVGDSVYYGSRTRSLTVDLDGAKRDDGEKGEGDTVGADVEVLMGGSGNDVLTGNGNGNHITGGRGNDTIRGGGGNDDIVGNNGADKIFGDAGSDRLIGENISYHHPDGAPQNSDTAKDVIDGGANIPNWGDYCVVRKAGKTVNCETFDR